MPVERTPMRPPKKPDTPPSGRAKTAFSLVPPSGAPAIGSDVQLTPPGTTVPIADRARVGPEDATQTVPVGATDDVREVGAGRERRDDVGA